MRLAPFVLGFALVGCSVPDDAAPAACGSPLSGTAPFGRVLRGTGDFRDGQGALLGTRELSVEIYFPRGRVAGAPVVLSHERRYPEPGLMTAQATLGADGSATGLTFGGSDGADLRVEAELLPGTDGLRANVTRNFADPGTDVSRSATAVMVLCDAGEVPAPQLAWDSQAPIGPLSPIGFSSNVPLDTSAPPLVQAAGLPVDVDSSFGAGRFEARAKAAFPPTAPLTVDLSAVKDVLGRPVPALAAPPSLQTQAFVSDGTLTSPPPDGAVVASGSAWSIGDGKLSIDGGTYGRAPFSLLLALGEHAGASTAHVRLQVSCAAGAVYLDAALVSASGATTPLALACHEDLVTLDAPLPDSGPLWLAFEHRPPHAVPQSHPPRPGNSLLLDDVAFD